MNDYLIYVAVLCLGIYVGRTVDDTQSPWANLQRFIPLAILTGFAVGALRHV